MHAWQKFEMDLNPISTHEDGCTVPAGPGSQISLRGRVRCPWGMGQDGYYLAGISPAGEIDDAKVAVKI